MVPSLKQDEKELEIIFNNFNDGVLLANLKDKKFSHGNPAICRMLGYTSKEIDGLGIEDIHPKESLPHVIEELEKQATGKVAIAKDIPVQRKDGSIFYADINSSPIVLNGVNYMLGIFRDVTDRKREEAELIRVNRALRMVSDINGALIHISEETALFKEACRIAIEVGGYKLAWIGLAQNDAAKTIRPVAHTELKVGYLETLRVTWADTGLGRGPSGTAIRMGRPVVARNIESDPMMAPWRENALKFNYRSSIALPLITNKNTFGVFVIYSDEKDAFSEKEVQILTEVTNDIAFGIATNRIRVEREQLEERYRHIVDTTNEGIWVLDKDRELTFVNPRTLQMLGYTEKELLGKKMDNFVALEELADHKRQMIERQNGNAGFYERRLLRKDGTPIWCNVSATPLFDSKQNFIGSFGMITDITERKKVEVEREQYFKFFNLSTDIMVIADPNGPFKRVNPTCLNELGYSADELISKPFIDFVHPDDKQSTLDEMQKQIASGSSLDFENRYICKDGKILWLSWRANFNKDEGITYATARDITERKKSEERIKDLSELRSKFLNIMAHQLRTPLSSVNWNLEMLISGDLGKIEDTQKKFLQVTYNESKKITNRIRDLLAAVDIEDRRILVKKEAISVDGLVTSIIGEAREHVKLKGLKFSYNGPSKELSGVVGDNEKLRIALFQLVENALIYTPDNGEVTVTLTEEKGVIRFEVKDTGIGIPVAEKNRIDERFYRASNASLMHPDGFGLGLYVAKYFIEQHGGKLGFESEEGKGSTFWAEIPIKKD